MYKLVHRATVYSPPNGVTTHSGGGKSGYTQLELHLREWLAMASANVIRLVERIMFVLIATNLTSYSEVKKFQVLYQEYD